MAVKIVRQPKKIALIGAPSGAAAFSAGTEKAPAALRAAGLVERLQNAGYEVTERVGKYPDGSQAYGIVGVLKNGLGPTVLVRTDLDALPDEFQQPVPRRMVLAVRFKMGR